jgi:hypothetical protein
LTLLRKQLEKGEVGTGTRSRTKRSISLAGKIDETTSPNNNSKKTNQHQSAGVSAEESHSVTHPSEDWLMPKRNTVRIETMLSGHTRSNSVNN